MRLTNFLVRDAIIPHLPVTAAGIDPRRPDRRPRRQAAGDRRDGRGTRTRPGHFRDDDLSDIVKAVMRREELGTTGHRPRHRHPALAAPVGGPAHRHAGARRATALPFESLDGEPVYVFFLLVSPQDRPGDHLRALEAVVRTMRDEDFVRRLRACQTRGRDLGAAGDAPRRGGERRCEREARPRSESSSAGAACDGTDGGRVP